MEKEKKNTKYEQIGITKEIILYNQTYTFKKELINFFISYRCKHCDCDCKKIIKTSIENSKKISNKKDYANSLEFIFSGEHENILQDLREDSFPRDDDL